MNSEQTRKAEELINNSTMHAIGNMLPDKTNWEADWVMALTDKDGYPAASMITAAKADGFKWVAFCTGLNSNKVKRIKNDSRACIYLFDNKSFTGISLVGSIEIIVDTDVKKQMWYNTLGDHYSSPDDEQYCVLMFTPKKYNMFMDFQTLQGSLYEESM